MSGRDLHTFITNYRAEDVEKLTLRMKYGLGSSKYKPAEYKELQAIVDAKRLESHLIGLKVHFDCYQYSSVSSSVSSVHKYYTNVCPCMSVGSGRLLEREQKAFRMATVQPVHQLKDDLRFRLGEVQHQQLTAHQSNWEQVIQQVSVWYEIKTCLNVHSDFDERALVEYVRKIAYFAAPENIPGEVLNSDCPYPELKDSLIQAFHFLSERYQMRLQNLQDQLQTTDRFCGWCADDHQRFQFTLSQYTHDIPNHRALYMDMLQRLFLEKTRQELVEHERVWDRLRFTQAQLRVVTQQCQRDQEELLAKALFTLQEASHAHQEELECHRGHRHQQDICSHLKEKLQQWRAQQEEVARLEAAIASRQQEEEEARLKREQEKEAVRQFYLQQQKRRQKLEARDQERLANLRSVMEEQARRDKERVVAEADPERMMADTEAWKGRHVNVKEFELQRPLYSVNTYTDTQIVSDPRVRVEQALREAGLQHSQYAKEVLSVISPPKPPRRDTKSTLKF
uniref:Coiled-coil domain containing 148 n=1 Tax=Cyclopterus lumpus TaxID=8103 RepID=A0A8C2ZBA1_CYCLU